MNIGILASSAPVAIIANRDFKLPADGWMQLFPFGEVSGPMPNPDGTTASVVQVLDPQAADTVLAAFRSQASKPNFGGVLVDFEHFSLDPSKESRAAAWIDELAKREDGVWFKPRITNSGKAALESGDYRFISPVLEFPPRKYRAGEKVRPIGLHSAGLTNDPQIKNGIPLSNRNGTPAGAAEKQPEPTMKTVLKLLGLADDASEDSAVAAVQLIQNRATTAENKATALTTERDTLLAAQVESDLEKYAPVIANRDDMKKQLLANRTGTLAVLASLKPAKAEGEPSPRITNRNAARTPEQIAADKAADQDKARGQKIANRAAELRRDNPRLSRAQAFRNAEAEIAS